MLKQKILQKKAGILTYAITPPKQDNPPEKIAEITQKHIERISPLAIDGLIVYDIQDEAERQKEARPFPFFQTVDPVQYAREHLKELAIPKIVYRCVGNYSKEDFIASIAPRGNEDQFSVFVGAASSTQAVSLRLSEAYALRRRTNPDLILGGITIPERHTQNGNEHLRILDKTDRGCQFFVSQVTYNLEAAKNLLSDYYYHCQSHQLELQPILFTITPCGSVKTLEFMKWLGIKIPRWLENDLLHSEDILDKSLDLSKKIFAELLEYAAEKAIPIGCNVESLSIRKVEIDASIQLVHDIQAMMRKEASPSCP